MENNKVNCEACQDEYDECQECCEHNEHDHGICLDCGKDILDSLIEDIDFYD